MTNATLRYGAFALALAIGVTVGGVAAGTMVVTSPTNESVTEISGVTDIGSPSLGASVTSVLGSSATAVLALTDRTMSSATASWRALPQPARRLWIPALLGLVALTGFGATGVSLLRRPPEVRETLASAVVTPSAKSRANRSASRTPSRTPKAVQALADSGAEPSEIAWRTGLSLDAVAMLLSIASNARQLRPPTA